MADDGANKIINQVVMSGLIDGRKIMGYRQKSSTQCINGITSG